MVKLNNFENGFGPANGEQAFWLDGELKSYVGGSPGKQLAGKWRGDAFVQGFPGGTTLPGIRWRTTRPNLMINYFWLEHFVDTDPGRHRVEHDVHQPFLLLGRVDYSKKSHATSACATRRLPVSEPAILGVGTRTRWRGVEVTDDGTPDVLGLFLLRLCRYYGGLEAVARKFVSEPWGWRTLPTRERRDDGWAPWFEPGNEHSSQQFLNWFVLDVEAGKLEVFDVNEGHWLEPALIAPDGRPRNRPAWVGDDPRWLSTTYGTTSLTSARILTALHEQPIAIDRARTVVAAWLHGLVPHSKHGDWQIWSGDDATTWSPWKIGEQRLWLPDQPSDVLPFALVLSTEDACVGFATMEVDNWRSAAMRAGVPQAEVARTLEALFAAAAAPWVKGPVKVAVSATMHGESEDHWLHQPMVFEMTSTISREEMVRLIREGQPPRNIIEGTDGYHLATEFKPPSNWIVDLIRAVNVPVEVEVEPLPERRRSRWWPFD